MSSNSMRMSEYDHPKLRFFIGDVHDKDRLRRAMQSVNIVVHAAALKQVPACDYNPIEAVATNIEGARDVIEAALGCGVERVIALITDRVVNPIDLYGATKFLAERLLIQANAYRGDRVTRFSCVRYGRVVGSRGSVIPLFMTQRKRGRIIVTDWRTTRFWIALEQGAQLVALCIQRMNGGEVFVPKIPSMSIVNLTKVLAPQCEIEEFGIRPGEKLHEILISEDEARQALEFEEYYLVQPAHQWWGRDTWTGGQALPEGFSYTSDNNTDWLDSSQMCSLAGDTE